MSVLNNSVIGQLMGDAAGYSISRSLRFNSSDSGYLSRVFTSGGNRKTFTFAAWVKRATLGTTQRIFNIAAAGNIDTHLRFETTNVLRFSWNNGAGAAISNAVYRDTSSWMHIALIVDTTQGTDSNRVKIFVNGTQISFSTTSWPTPSLDLDINRALEHRIGLFGLTTPPEAFDGYLADIWFLDGLTPTSATDTTGSVTGIPGAVYLTQLGEFSATTGVWQPKAWDGAALTGNSFHLEFADNASNTATTLGKDTSGLNNNWNVFNISTTTGGPTSVAAASGALPIYNTTDTYGATKGTGTRTDSNSSSIVLAIPMDGGNNGTTFTDESATVKGSGSAKSITRNGDTKTSTAQSKFYGSSGYFDATGDYLAIADSADFDFGTGDFTIEAWIYPNSLSVNGGSIVAGVGPTNGTWMLSTISSDLRFGQNMLSWDIQTSGGMSTGKWQHVAVSRSGTSLRLFIDGVVRASSTNSTAYNVDTGGIAAGARQTTSSTTSYGEFFDGYMSDLRIYKGVAKYTGNFNPPSSTANATIAAGNDSVVDVPTSSGTDSGLGGEVRGNYSTLNPLALTAHTLANGNLDVSSSAIGIAVGTIGMSTGKWYWEITLNTVSANVSPTFGYVNQAFNTATAGTTYLGSGANDGCVRRDNGQAFQNNTSTSYTGAAGFSAGDVAMVAFDADAKKMWVGKNGTWYNSGAPASGTGNIPLTITGTAFFPAFNTYGDSWSINFGARSFAYTAPSGFKALCSSNLPAPLVTKPSSQFQVVTDTGANIRSTAEALSFGADLIWVKDRANNSTNHQLLDTTRGGNAIISTSSDAAEGTYSAPSGNSVAWCWNESVTAGFDIVGYAGDNTSNRNISHSLGVGVDMAWIKSRSSGSFYIWHRSLASTTHFLKCNQTDGTASSTNTNSPFGTGNWSSTQFMVTNNATNNLNAASTNYIAYLWSTVVGYSSFGSYTGNGSTDGPFVYTGFRPRWILLKRTSSTSSWGILDTARGPINVASARLLPDTSDAEADGTHLTDFLSNGFKLRNTSTWNESGSTYIYFALAESPFNYARAR